MRSLAVLIIPLFALSLAGCASEELAGPLPDNVPPVAWLAIGPPAGSTVNYKVHMFWGGWDPDGRIAYFEYSITDNETGVFQPADTTGSDNWHRVNAKDSVFVFTTDLLADSSSIDSGVMDTFEYLRTHTFFIRAVDEEGARSKAVYRSFTANNLSPVVFIETPRAFGFTIVQVPPIPTFRWNANDFVATRDETQDPDSVRSILVSTLGFGGGFDETTQYIRENPDAPEWTPWEYYNAPGDTGRFWHPEDELGFGSYVFAVQVKDEAGAVSPVFDLNRNMRRIRISLRKTGPVLTVTTRFLGSIVTSSPNAPLAILDIPAGMPIGFSWKADASSYGGIVTAYRYGWDILDLNDDEQWDVDFTPFIGSLAQSPSRTFFFGTHTFYVEVVDNSGFTSRQGIVVNVIPFTMERELLMIDDWEEGSSPGFFRTNGGSPHDTEHDAFWADVLSDVAGFSPDIDMLPSKGKLVSLPIGVIAKYKAIIWNTRGNPAFIAPSLLNEMTKFNSDKVNLLALYMAAGGKLLICGGNVMTAMISRNIYPLPKGPAYPFIFRYEVAGDQSGSFTDQEKGVRGVGDDSFPYNEFCLNVVDAAYGVNLDNKRIYCRIFSRFRDPVKFALRDYSGKTDGLRACDPVDDTYAFPRLELRPKVSDPGKIFHEDQLGLNCDVYNPLYFEAVCDAAELSPLRSCFQPMYALECLNQSSNVFGEPVAFWTSRFADVPNPQGVAARSAVWGFEPVYFNPDQIRKALGIILFDEWQLSRR